MIAHGREWVLHERCEIEYYDIGEQLQSREVILLVLSDKDRIEKEALDERAMSER